MSTTNPLKQETFTDKAAKIFKKSDKLTPDFLDRNAQESIRWEFVGCNMAIDIIAEACACCWDKAIPDAYPDRCVYVGKRTKTGHTSILEHSNYVMYIRVSGISHVAEMLKFVCWNDYLKQTLVQLGANDFGLMLSGSLRGYADLYRECDDLNNIVLRCISALLYQYAPGAAFEDISKLGLLDGSKFGFVDDIKEFMGDRLLTCVEHVEVNENIEIIGMDGIPQLLRNITIIDPDFAKMLTTRDLIKHVSISILFKNMSRIITQQLTRHRNAITQESQRYVNYSKASFNSPGKFKEKIDDNHKYSIRFGPSSPLHMTLNEIGNAVIGLYNMVSNPVLTGKEFALANEDARGILPGNTQCRKLYMTFTYKNFFKFLLLREASGAQAEIRKYAAELGEWFRNNSEFKTKEVTDLYTQPKLLIEDPFKFDVAIEKPVESVIDTDEYFKAAGLETPDKVENGEAPATNEV